VRQYSSEKMSSIQPRECGITADIDYILKVIFIASYLKVANKIATATVVIILEGNESL